MADEMPRDAQYVAVYDVTKDRERNRVVTGDPRAMQKEKSRRGQPASFSRFVLPVPYRLRKLPPDTAASDHWFEEAGGGDWLHSAERGAGGSEFERYLDQERRAYFTRESNKVLHQEARWLGLRTRADAPALRDRFNLRVQRDGRKWEWPVRVRPPALVLFECPATPDHRENVGMLQQAMLVIEVWWEKPEAGQEGPRLEDLLTLNELFRYFLPPFERHTRRPGLKEDGPEAGKNYREVLGDLAVEWPAGGQKIQDVKGDGAAVARSAYLRRWEWLLEQPVMLKGPDGHTTQRWSWVPPDWLERARGWAVGEGCPGEAGGQEDEREDGWLQHADNRTFVWTCAVLEKDAPLGQRVTAWGKSGQPEVTPELGDWVRLLNVDLPAPGDCTPFEATWATPRTHRRWAHFGLLQGYNHHAGALLTDCCDEPPTWRHFGAMYFDQTLLLLYLRTTLFRFSYRLGQLSSTARRRDDPEAMEGLAAEFEQVRLDFALFTNLYQFPLLSNQQQGIELYSICRKQMDVRKLFTEVEKEIMTSHDFLNLRTQQKLGQLSARLTLVATVGLVAGLVLGVFSADYLLKAFLGEALGAAPAIVLLVIFSGLCLMAVLGVVHRSACLQRFLDRLAGCGKPLDRCLEEQFDKCLSSGEKTDGSHRPGG